MNTTALTWGKIVLIFQAVITLLIGLVFFLQITGLDEHGIKEIKFEINEEISSAVNQSQENYVNISQRFEIAGYILLVIAIIEILIVSRFVS
ncbi:hypothetical protein CMI41_03735 [Candidatus Pacearchaeota archaeon]|nr:hypothetical protein [Candidatus Pacearchaeota archaeon]|tara:strand:- start:2546 stop:2821 length:276 start_codon:yes stop_codon:yes gene_type:complete